MKKKLDKAIQWFDEMVHSFGIKCETSSFIHNILVDMLMQMLDDGTMIWDDEMVEKAYPQAVDMIKRKERERIINEIEKFLMRELNRRLDNGK